MKPKHTPGPWTIQPERKDIPDTLRIHTIEPKVAMITGSRANAFLIAAAPDLLKAAIAVMDSQYGTFDDRVDSLQQLVNAIAKAEGGK